MFSLNPIYQLLIKTTVIFALVLIALPLGLDAQNNVPKTPRGWTAKTVNGKKKRVEFTKDGIQAPDYLAVKFYDREVLVDRTIPQWIQKRLITGAAPLKGKWTGPIENLTRYTKNLYSAQRDFSVDGNKHSIEVTVVSVDNLNVRMAATIKSQSRSVRAHNAAAQKLQAQLFQTEIAAVKADPKRGLAIEHNPPNVKGIKGGGIMKPGRYVGTTVSKRDKKAGAKIDLVIFENGEYEFLDRKRNNTGVCEYSSATGRLQVDKPFENDIRDWDEEFCIYGKDQKGNWVIHAESKFWTHELKWIEASDRIAPSELKRQNEIAKAESSRYKHTTEPGEGIQADEIEAIMYSWEQKFRSGAIQIDYDGFLLMKDGRVLDGLPVAPDTIDLTASRSRAPDSWGWWKKAKNDRKGRYEFSWPARPQEYRIPNGHQVTGVPFKPGTKLNGDYGTASTSGQIILGYSSVRWWGIKFDTNGRFLKYQHGSTQSGGVPGMETLVTTVWHDKSSASAFTGPIVVGGSRRKLNNPAYDRMGKYEFDGYRLTLKFDSGRVEHHATFTNKNQNSVWFEGRSLSKKKEKAIKKK